LDLRQYVGKNIHIIYRRKLPAKIKIKKGQLIAVCHRQICLRCNYGTHDREIWVDKPRPNVDTITILDYNIFDIKQEAKK